MQSTDEVYKTGTGEGLELHVFFGLHDPHPLTKWKIGTNACYSTILKLGKNNMPNQN